MADNLTPDTTLALLQAAQGDSAKATKNLKAAKQARDLEKAQEAAVEFEAVFVAEMMKPMFEGISTEAPFGGGKGEEVFRSLLLQEYGKLISRTGSIGLSDHVREEMIRMQAEIDGSATQQEGVEVASDE